MNLYALLARLIETRMPTYKCLKNNISGQVCYNDYLISKKVFSSFNSKTYSVDKAHNSIFIKSRHLFHHGVTSPLSIFNLVLQKYVLFY